MNASGELVVQRRPKRIATRPEIDGILNALVYFFPQHFLYFFPLPHGQGALREGVSDFNSNFASG